MEKLHKLLKLLADRKTWENAVVTAIDLQGVPATASTAKDVEREVDYVTFVLDRLGPPAQAVAELKHFVMMLLLLMVAKMLKKPFNSTRCQQFGMWFEALANNIESDKEDVNKHYKDVVDQIKTHLAAARRENPTAFEDEALSAVVQTSLKTLIAKVRS